MNHSSTFYSVLFACLTVSGLCQAQTITLDEAGIQRSKGFRGADQNPSWISRADCLDNDVFGFPLAFSGDYASYQLEVWVGTSADDCVKQEARVGAAQVCWKVWEGVATSAAFTVKVPVRNIVSRDLEAQYPGLFDESVCELEEASTSARPVGVYFMFTSGDSMVGGNKWATAYDLAGPPPPKDVAVESRNDGLVVTWTDSDTDVVAHNIYCQRSTVPGAGGGQLCETLTLYSGAFPPEDPAVLCAEVKDMGTSGAIGGLDDGVSYSAAVAGVDSVGNVGRLSHVVCDSPKAVSDSTADDAGDAGQCSVSAAIGHRTGVFGLGLLVLLGAAGVLRRRSLTTGNRS